jgi:hypothetical protein
LVSLRVAVVHPDVDLGPGRVVLKEDAGKPRGGCGPRVGAGSVPAVWSVDRVETTLLSCDPRVVDAVVAFSLGVATAILVGSQEQPSVVGR